MAGEWQSCWNGFELNKAVAAWQGSSQTMPDYAGTAGELGGCLAKVVKADGEVLAVAPEEDRFFLEGLPQFTRSSSTWLMSPVRKR